eukprot:gene2630-3320_t
MRRLSTVLVAPAMVYAGLQDIDTQPPYRDPNRPVDERVDDLLARMTINEKVAQLGYTLGSMSGSPESIAHAHPDGIGGAGLADLNVTRRNAIQAAVMNVTRLGIPISFYAETTH